MSRGEMGSRTTVTTSRRPPGYGPDLRIPGPGECTSSSSRSSRHESHSAAYEPSAAISSSWVPSSATARPRPPRPGRRRGRCAAGGRSPPPCGPRARRRAIVRGGGRRAGRSAKSPRRAPACAGRPAPAGPARAAAPAPGVSEPPAPTRVSSPSGSASTQTRASTAASAAASSASVAPGRASTRFSPDRAHEHVVLLGDQRDLAAQLVERQVDQPHAADRHPARRAAAWMPAISRPERRLARARRPDHREPLAGRAGPGRRRAARRGRRR